MTSQLLGNVTAGLLFLWASPDSNQEPAQPEILPPPRQSVMPAQPPVFARPNPYDIWQYYAVGRNGHFGPLVIYSPYGAYYLYNGEPFPWTNTRPLEIAPKVVD